MWHHEQEWRLVCKTEEEYLFFDCIRAIYLGLEFIQDRASEKKLISIAKSMKDMKIKKCFLSKKL